MQRFLAFFLALLLLLQTFGRELVVLDYQLHKERVTELFCVNKAKPQLHCNGKCHLRKQLRKAESESKTPASSVAKVKYEVLPSLQLRLPAQQSFPLPIRRYAPGVAVRYASRPLPGIFRPPLFRA